MSLSRVVRSAAVVLVVLAPGAAVASGSGQGDFAPPKTKKQCLHILKADRQEWAQYRESYPSRKQAAQDKIDARKADLAALIAQRRAINQQIDAIMNSDTSGLTQADVDAMNAQIDALTKQKAALQRRIDTAGGKIDEARLAYKDVVAKFLEAKKNWPPYLAQIAAYCAKM